MLFDKKKISNNQEVDLVEQVNRQDYFKNVIDLGDKIDLVAGGDNLISEGTRVGSSFYDRLIKHKQLKPIDRSLNASDAIDLPVPGEAIYQIIRTVEEIKWRWPGNSEPHNPITLGQYISHWLVSTRTLMQSNT